MNIPPNVKIKRFPLTVLPIFSKYTAVAAYPNIYMNEDIYNELRSKNPKPKCVSILIHEQTHIERQKDAGWFLWGLKYLFSSKFRFEEEMAAIKASMPVVKKAGLDWDFKRHAGFLSSYLYLWCTSFEEAKRRLEEAWISA